MRSAAKVKPRAHGGLEYPYAEAPAPAAVREVAPGVYWLRMPLPFALEHINLWLLEDGDGWAIVDCGFGAAATRELWQQIFAVHLHGRLITRIIVTHFHPDHFGLAAWLAEEWQAPVLMTGPEFASAQAWHTARELFTREAYLAMFRKHGLSPGADDNPLTRENLFRRGVPAIPHPVSALRERVRLLHRHHAERLDELQRACDQPRTGAELMPVLFKRALDPQQTFFAMGETLSHLNYLQKRAQLKREMGADGIYRFARA